MVSVHLLHLAPASSHPNGWTIHCLTGHQRQDWRQKKRMSTNVVNLIIDHLQLGHVVSGKNWVMHGFPRFVASTSLLSPLDIWTRIITIFQITRHLKMFMTVLARVLIIFGSATVELSKFYSSRLPSNFLQFSTQTYDINPMVRSQDAFGNIVTSPGLIPKMNPP